MTYLYIFQFICFILLFLFVKKTKDRLDAVSWAFYGIITCLVWQGLSSFFFHFTKIPLTFNSLCASLFIGNLLMVCANIRVRDNTIIFRIQKYYVDFSILITQFISITISVIAGILFFTPDLIPSSMTGDPGRHYLSLLDLLKENNALKYKPIYNVCCSTFIYIFKEILYKDQLFIVFNIISLGLVTQSCSLLLLRILPNIKKRYIFLYLLLVCFGYPYLALQYGYNTLLFSSIFLFTTIALCIEYVLMGSSLIMYAHITLVLTGVILTHSYLLPETLLSLIIFTFFYEYSKKGNYLYRLMKYSFFWFCLIGITYFSNFDLNSSSLSSVEYYAKVVTAPGFVNEDFLLSLLPFILLSFPYIILSRKDIFTKTISIFIICGALFSCSMYVLMLIGRAAPYYVNRNHLFLMPLLILTSVLGLTWIESYNKRYSTLLCCIFFLIATVPYLIYPYIPLSKSSENFMLLKTANQPTHLQAASITRFVPLQMTSKDRELFLSIRSDKIKLFGKNIEKLPVIGSDHEVIWFYIYTGIYPSLFERKDGFVLPDGYLKNYDMWKSDSKQKFIVLIKHLNYDIPLSIINDIESRCNVIIEGDSFKICEKK